MAIGTIRKVRPSLAVLLLAAVVLGGIAAPRKHAATSGNDPKVASAGTLVASLRAEPRSFNRYIARDFSTTVVTLLVHDTLVRINRVTDRLEPALADRWDLLANGRTYRIHLRNDVRFSDGTPLDADDVVFSFRVIADSSTDSVLAETLQVRGRPVVVTRETASTVLVEFPSPTAAGLRMLDGVPIYPRHRLEGAFKIGAFRTAWNLSSALSDIVGLGPYVLTRYEPGQRLTFEPNRYYWRDATRHTPRPHLVLEIVPDQDSELLQLETGAIDFTQSELRPSDIAALKRSTGDRTAVVEAGVGLDGDLFWVNLAPTRVRAPRSAWLQHRDFRRAIALSVDRRQFADTVYLGAAQPADSIVSPGNRSWHVDASLPPFDPDAAQRLLDGLGTHDLRFTLVTQKGNTSLERGAAVIRESLARVGVHVDVVALEVGALIETIMRGDYDAAYFRLLTTDSDPSLNLDFWLSSGSAHVWHPQQRTPATPWEAEIDRLMDRVSTSGDVDERRASFASVQRIIARELPVMCFAFPRIAVGTSLRLAHAQVAAFRPPLLWNPGEVDVVATY
jgi:peptide/nickel transport system substrate-binding protein